MDKGNHPMDTPNGIRPAASGGRGFLWWVLALALAAGLTIAFQNTFAEMWTRWFPAWRNVRLSLYDRLIQGESYYTHGPLVPLVSLLIAALLIRHTRIDVRPRPIAGTFVLICFLLAHLAACFARVNFVSGFAMIGVIAGLVLTFWGAGALKRFWFPLAFLAFMVPLPDVTIADINFRLKMFATSAGVSMANMLGVLADASGNRVVLQGDKSLVVANVCNGLRTLISLLAFGALFAYVCRLRGAWRLVLFAMSIPVAVASNAIRVVSLIVVADVWSVEAATGWYHDTSGILIYGVAFLLMFGLERLILWLQKPSGKPLQVQPLFADVRRSAGDLSLWAQARQNPGRWRMPIAVATILLTAGMSWHLTQAAPPIRPPGSLRLPTEMTVGGKTFFGYPQKLDQNTLTILETQDYAYSRFVGVGRGPVDLCIILSQDNRKGTHPPDLCLQGSGEGIVGKESVTIDGIPGRGPVQCSELLVQTGNQRTYYLFVYRCGTQYTSSFWGQQWTILANGLLSRDAAGALVRISTPVQDSVGEARQCSVNFMKELLPWLDQAMLTLEKHP